MRDYFKLIAPAAALLIFFALLLPTAADAGLRRRLFVDLSHYVVAAMFLTWVAALAGEARASSFSPAGFLRRRWGVLAAALALTLAVVLSVEGGFRILGDETNLLGVSRTLSLEQKAYGVVEGMVRAGGDSLPLQTFVPKRPLLYPFFVHLLHLATGLRWQNGLLLNGMALFVLLAALGCALARIAGSAAGAAAMLLALSDPVLTLTARSSGFDLFSTLWFVLLLLALAAYMRAPSTARFALFWTGLLMFAHVRYENVAVVATVAAGLALLGYVRGRHLRESLPLLGATPLFLLPLIWQLFLSRGTYGSVPGRPLLSAKFFLANLGDFLARGFSPGRALISPHTEIVLPLALAAALLFLLRAMREGFPSRLRLHFLALLLLALGTQLALVLSLAPAHLNHHYMERLYLAPYLFSALAPLGLLLLPRPPLGPRPLLLLALTLFLLAHPRSMDPRALHLQYPGQEEIVRFLEGRREGILAVAQHPDRLNGLGFPAVSFSTAAARPDLLLNGEGEFAHTAAVAFVIVDEESGQRVPETPLPEGTPGTVLHRSRPYPGYRLEAWLLNSPGLPSPP